MTVKVEMKKLKEVKVVELYTCSPFALHELLAAASVLHPGWEARRVLA